jgi:hypothetical protein
MRDLETLKAYSAASIALRQPNNKTASSGEGGNIRYRLGEPSATCGREDV